MKTQLNQDLLGKTIRINGNMYNVIDQAFDRYKEEEILILSRKLNLGDKDNIETINDLGYNSYEEVKYSEKDMKEAWYNEIIPQFKKGRQLPILFVEKNGLLKLERVEFRALNIEDPSLVELNLLTSGSFGVLLPKKILITAYLLYKEKKEKEKNFNNSEFSGGDLSKEEVEEVMKLFDELIGRFHGKC